MDLNSEGEVTRTFATITVLRLHNNRGGRRLCHLIPQHKGDTMKKPASDMGRRQLLKALALSAVRQAQW